MISECAAGAPIGFAGTVGRLSLPMSVKTYQKQTNRKRERERDGRVSRSESKLVSALTVFLLFSFSQLTSTYETGNMPFRLAIRPSNQFSSTRRVSTTSSPLFSDSSMADCAGKLNLARACPSDGFFVGCRTPSFEIICLVAMRVGRRSKENQTKCRRKLPDAARGAPSLTST